MYEPLRRRTLALLKVPAEPHPPVGDPASLRVFRAGRNYFRLRLAGWAAAQLIALAAFLFWTAILIEVEVQVDARKSAESPPPVTAEVPADPANGPADANQHAKNWIERIAENIRSAAAAVERVGHTAKSKGIGAWVDGYKQFFVELALRLPAWVFPLIWAVKIVSFGIYLLQIPFTYAVRRLDYEMRWYLVTDRSLRIRHGVWNVAESTMSFANIQQVAVNQGPVQRLLGLADVKVQSAGGGGGDRDRHHRSGEDMHLGLFHCVTNAPEIRDLILERLRRFRESGLGDPEERSATTVTAPVASAAGAVAAARELLAEARALRAALS